MLRSLMQKIVGRVPFVSILHPEWSDYRDVAPVLRDAARKPRSSITYVADGVCVFGGILGPPDFPARELIESTDKRQTLSPASSEIVIIELSSAILGSWADLAMSLLPLIRPNGRFVLYLRNAAGLSYKALRDLLNAGLGRLSSRLTMNSMIAVQTSTSYRSWLKHGFPLALSMARARRPAALLRAGALACTVTGLTALANLFARHSRLDDSAPEAWSSVTIIIPVDEAASRP
jgi:hypothetical protein